LLYLVLSPTLQLLCIQTKTSLLPITDSSDNPNDNKLSRINSPISRTPLLNGYYSSVISLSFRPQLLKSWIAPSTGKTTIQWISIRETNCVIQRIEFYPVDSVIHLARVVQTLDSAIQRKNYYPVDKYQGKQLHYPVDRDSSIRWIALSTYGTTWAWSVSLFEAPFTWREVVLGRRVTPLPKLP